jgi:hypothetical protein
LIIQWQKDGVQENWRSGMLMLRVDPKATVFPLFADPLKPSSAAPG